jgi:alkylation response protein AidB-like acyl-CoA dehydrogenase
MASAALKLRATPHGASFVCRSTLVEPVFTPERFTEEQLQFYKTARDFSRTVVEPRVAELERKRPGLLAELMQRAAELGLFTISIPEQYGGLATDRTTSLLITEALSAVSSFAVSHGAQTGIGALPLVYYGTDEQKGRYLPRLATGELIAAYALSEPGSGSDALGAKTTARLSADGKHYILSGTKQWITNAGLADLITVFAQVEGGGFTAFLVERSMPGVSIGREEHKLGIRGSSTCQVILEEVRVPVANVLGQVGRGHKIAFNILNVGRLSLGAGSLGGAKYAFSHGVRYTKERRQFGQPIASFGLVRSKLAHGAALIYACESMAYRTSGMIDAALRQLSPSAADYATQAQAVLDEFSIEASVVKVFGSEAAWRVIDDMLQLFGGNGYVEDYPIERVLRDARVNRIFEGTNEINRLLIPSTLLKRAMQGRVPLLEFAAQVQSELAEPARLPRRGDGPLGEEGWATELARRAIVHVASHAAQKYLESIKDQQHLLGHLADCLIDLYAMDSVVARAHQAQDELGGARAQAQVDLASLFCLDARARIFGCLRRAAMSLAEGEAFTALADELSRLDQPYRVDVFALEEAVAQRALDRDGYAV